MAIRRANAAIAAVAGFLCGIVGAELALSNFRSVPKDASASPLLFSVEVRAATGELLASPLLLGEEGRKLHLDLTQPAGGPRTPRESAGRGDQPALQMSLDLDPRRAGAEKLCLGYELSLDSGAPLRGRIALHLGQPRSLGLGSEELRVSLVVARAGSAAFERLLRSRGVRPLI